MPLRIQQNIFQTQRRLLTAALAIVASGMLLLAFFLHVLFTPAHALPANDFVTTWKTDNPGSSNGSSITIPTTGGGYNYDVDWDNDGTFDEFGLSGSVTHDFGTPGTYTIRIQGNFPRIYFNNTGDKNKIININQWGTGQWSSMAGAFFGCANLNSTATDVPDLSNVTDMSHMFHFASSFNGDVSGWNTGTVTDMSSMFNNATSFNQPIGSWNTSNVTDMSYLFFNAPAFDQPLNSWNTSNVTDMSAMFFNSSSGSFNGDITSWNTSNVTSMFAMFLNATAFNQNISNWDTSNVTNMTSMFSGATAFNQPIGSWDTSKVESMGQVFYSTTSFNQDISSWDVSSATNMNDSLSYAGFSRDMYDVILAAWAAQPVQNNVTLGAQGLYYCSSVAARQSLISNHSWTISGDTKKCDDDGVDDSVEDNGPNGGDANGDGILDSDQNNVASFPNQVLGGGHYVTLQADSPGNSCQTVSNVFQYAEEDTGEEDTDYTYPVGLTDFTLQCTSPGGSATITVYYDQLYNTTNWVPRKYSFINGGYRPALVPTFGTFNRNGTLVTTMTYTITDGGALDDDGMVDGVIYDPIGPALSPTAPVDNNGGSGGSGGGSGSGSTGAPNTGVGANVNSSVLILSVLIVLTGLGAYGVRQLLRKT